MFTAQDGYLVIAIANDALFAALCRVMGQPDLQRDERYDTNDHRSEHEAELKILVEAWLQNFTVDQASTLLTEAGIPASAVLNIAEVCNSPHIMEREMLITVQHPIAGSTKIHGNPVKFSQTKAMIQDPFS